MWLNSAVVVALLMMIGGSASAASSPDPRVRAGAALYAQYCVPCHGPERTGYAADNAPSLVSPTFRETADDAFLRSAIDRGRAGTAMGGYGSQFGGPLVPFEINEIIVYLRDGTVPAPLPAKPSAGSISNGQRVYRTHCESCHGTPEQRGNAVHLANP